MKMRNCHEDGENEWNVFVPLEDSATLRMALNKQRINILKNLNDVLKERRSVENRRNSLLQSAVSREQQVQDLRNEVLGFRCDIAWQQKLLLAQASGTRIQNECIILRERRDAVQKHFISAIEKNIPCKPVVNISPSLRANYKIQASLLQKDIAELKRRVLHTKFRLDSEIKAIDKLSSTVKKLRIELGTKRLNSMSIRPQTLALLTHANQCRSTRENFRLNMMKNMARTSTSLPTPRDKLFK